MKTTFRLAVIDKLVSIGLEMPYAEAIVAEQINLDVKAKLPIHGWEIPIEEVKASDRIISVLWLTTEIVANDWLELNAQWHWVRIYFGKAI